MHPGRTLTCACSGKGLGGSSSINFLFWTRPQKEEIDSERLSLRRTYRRYQCSRMFLAMELLGNPGWNWERFYEASKRSESCVAPLAFVVVLDRS